jgi:hypothetical protein
MNHEKKTKTKIPTYLLFITEKELRKTKAYIKKKKKARGERENLMRKMKR